MKKTIKDDLKSVLWIIVILALFGGTIIGVIALAIESDEKSYDNFCQEKGFDEATDYNLDSEKIHIECGKGNIFLDLYCTEETYCSGDQLNKWGDCKTKLSRMRCIE